MRDILRYAAFILVPCFLTVLLLIPAAAAPVLQTPGIALIPSRGQPGSEVIVSVSQWSAYAGQTAQVYWADMNTVVASIHLSTSTGSGSTVFTVPNTASGNYPVRACVGGDCLGIIFTVVFGVQPSPTTMPTSTFPPGVATYTPRPVTVPTATRTPTITPFATVFFTPTPLSYNPNVAPLQSLFNNPDSPLGFMTDHLPLSTPCASLGLGPSALVQTFDDLDPGPLAELPEVTFLGSSGAVASPPMQTHSGTQAVTSSVGNNGSTDHPIVMAFDGPMQAVGMFVGRETPSANAYESIVAVLTGYGWTPAGQQGVVARAALELPGKETPIDRCLVMHAPSGATITSAMLEYYNNGDSPQVEPSVYDRRWMDDLTLLPSDAHSTTATPVSPVLPTPTASPQTGKDIILGAIEITQAVQTMFDDRYPDNSLPMIAGKPTLVRVYPRLTGMSGNLERISGMLCLGDTGDGGCADPLRPFTPVTLQVDRGFSAMRNDLESTLNFLLPADWLKAGEPLLLTAYVNFREENTAEAYTANNTLTVSVQVVAGSPLNLSLNRISVDGQAAEQINTPLIAGLQDLYPVPHVNYTDAGILPISQLDFNDGGWTSLLDLLNTERLITDNAALNQHTYALVDPSLLSGAPAGAAEMPGYAAGGMDDPIDLRGSLDLAAYEIGHNLGRADANGADPDYPNPAGTLDQVGVDVRGATLYPVTASDFMNPANSSGERWTSAYTYSSLLRAIGSVSFNPFTSPRVEAAPKLQVSSSYFLTGSGVITPQGLANLGPLFLIQRDTPTYDNLPAGPYTLELQDWNGQVLVTRGFGIPTTGQTADDTGGAFRFVVPEAAGARVIVFKYNSVEIGRRSASAGHPEVSVTAPAEGTQWGPSGVQTVSWQGSDPDGDSLTYLVQYSCDRGNTWLPLGGETTETNLEVDVSSLPGGSECQVRVYASDGLDTASAVSEGSFSAALKPPQAAISNPQDSLQLHSGWPVILSAVATDAEDGPLPAESLQWSADDGRFLGNGYTLAATIQELGAGKHSLTLTATDSDGMNTSVSTTVQLTAPPSAAVNLGSTRTWEQRRSWITVILAVGGVLVLLGVAVGSALVIRKRLRKSDQEEDTTPQSQP
jgi:hypothetical protein